MSRVFHAERVPQALQHFVAWWIANGPFDIVCTSGSRNDVQQLVEWIKGRKQVHGLEALAAGVPNGGWIIVDHSAVVTYAQTAASSAHGHDAAGDFYPVKEVAPGGWVASVYLGSKKQEDPETYAEAIRRFIVMADLAETNCDLESGRHFPDPDLPHLEDPDWRSLPKGSGVA